MKVFTPKGSWSGCHIYESELFEVIQMISSSIDVGQTTALGIELSHGCDKFEVWIKGDDLPKKIQSDDDVIDILIKSKQIVKFIKALAEERYESGVIRGKNSIRESLKDLLKEDDEYIPNSEFDLTP